MDCIIDHSEYIVERVGPVYVDCKIMVCEQVV